MKPRSIELTAAAERDLEKMEDEDAESVMNALVAYAETRKGDVKKLKGREEEWRLRCGKWRVIFTPEGRVLRVLRVRRRTKAYR